MANFGDGGGAHRVRRLDSDHLDLVAVVNLDALREALEYFEDGGAYPYDPYNELVTVLAAAREYLLEHESERLAIVKEDGEWPEGVEVWWFCKTEGQRRKRHLRCDPLWNCKSDSGCGIRLFVPIGALTYSVSLSESERNAVVLDALAAAQGRE